MSASGRRDVHFTGGRTAADPRSSEEARELLQRRLALLGLVTLCLSGGFFAISVLGEALLDGPTAAARTLGEPRRFLNLTGALVSAGVWLLARGGRRSPGALLGIDVTGTVLAVVPYTFMSVEQGGLVGVLMAALTVMLVLVSRALMVPSDARRTFAISASAATLAFAIAFAARFGELQQGPGAQDLAHLSLNLAAWLSVAVAMSTIASWVLFGLREEVREARRLGQYTLLEKLGEGGMGTVYRARHALLRRPTAVKLLPPDRAGAGAVKRFEKEVQLTASLVHPNTVTVFDYGHTPDGVFYYAMEYLDGGDLDEVVAAAGPLPPGRARHILAQVAAGLSEAHEIGLIHRDIKPANILLASQGAVADLAKLLDFGLVRELTGEEASNLTATDTVLGTPLYLAPEAISNPDAVDARIDLYALGAVGYFLLTGEHVFNGKTVVEICSHHLHSQPTRPSERVGHALPEMLEDVLMSCLAKDPDQRPASAEALHDLLLSCDDVEEWEPGAARAWWKEHGPRIQRARAPGEPVDATARTIEINPRERSGAE